MSNLIHEHTIKFDDMNQLLLALLDAEELLERSDKFFLESEIIMNKTKYILRIKIFNA